MEVERGTHIEECPNCGSDRVFHDPEASGDREQWYDFLGCGTRLMCKWKPEGASDADATPDEQVTHDRFSDFEMDIDADEYRP